MYAVPVIFVALLFSNSGCQKFVAYWLAHLEKLLFINSSTFMNSCYDGWNQMTQFIDGPINPKQLTNLDQVWTTKVVSSLLRIQYTVTDKQGKKSLLSEKWIEIT